MEQFLTPLSTVLAAAYTSALAASMPVANQPALTDSLEGYHRLPELLALPGVLQRRLQRPLRQPHRLRPDTGAGAVEEAHYHGEAGSLPADEVGCRHAAVFEDQLPGYGGADAHLVFPAPEAEAGGILFHQYGAGAADALVLIRQNDDGIQVCLAAVGDELLGAVDNVAIAGADGGRLYALGSLPAPSSVTAKAVSFLPLAMSGRYFCFCSSLPYSSSVRLPRALTA